MEKQPLQVPFLDLRAPHDPLRAELVAAIRKVTDRRAFAGSPMVAKLEGACVA